MHQPWLLAMIAFFLTAPLFAQDQQDFLLKVDNEDALTVLREQGMEIVPINLPGWYRLTKAKTRVSREGLMRVEGVSFVQPNYRIHLIEDYSYLFQGTANASFKKPDWKLPPYRASTDPLFKNQWGMNDIGVTDAWQLANTKGSKDIVVAVIDTGVDYNHEDLASNIWINPGETGLDANGNNKATNGIDDDGDGYIDDYMGWDFVDKDNKPMDVVASQSEMVFKGGNPGHGTHCAGNVAAAANGKGIMGVAPGVKIMPLRFISKDGQGTTADAIGAIVYAVNHGAQVLSNSWGSEGEDDGESTENKALRDAVTFAQDHNVLFIAAAGNGHQGVGYDNDTDAKPGYPASYDMDTIVSVAAIDINNNLGSFSNWGKRSVDLAAPGVKVYSTMVGNKYSDVVLEFWGQKVYWDGTSMATPHVAGAAALYWSQHPGASFRQVKDALLKSVVPVPALKDKLVSGGKLNVKNLIQQN